MISFPTSCLACVLGAAAAACGSESDTIPLDSRDCRAEAEACFCPASSADNCDAYLDGQVDCDGEAGTPASCNAELQTRLPLGAAASKALDECQSTQCKTECGF